MPTPHIDAVNGEIAECILLTGDPLRAKFIAETYMSDVKQFNHTRNMLGYTGTYDGKPISVMGTGMGVPSIGIYSYELIKFYGCKKLVRVGTAGSMQPNLHIGDIVLAQGACYTSNMPTVFAHLGSYSPICDYKLMNHAIDYMHKNSIRFKAGNVLTTDLFYTPGSSEHAGLEWADFGVLCVEMETAMLYMNAAMYGAHALSILTMSDSLVTGEHASNEDREKRFTKMMEVALYAATREDRK
ncbi:MAG: purine-nucleoside phosphorylase [Lachnospiraceae bacterium]|nr:purine-nucleoside phosphorylase [Candidatus Darwinimomas equi]